MSQEGEKSSSIEIDGYEPQPCMKYFPNYDNEYVFEAFTVPYHIDPSNHPSALVLSSIINQNIQQFNEIGGSFLFKGALVSYLRGGRKKFIEL